MTDIPKEEIKFDKEKCKKCPYNRKLKTKYDVYFPIQMCDECIECMNKRFKEMDEEAYEKDN